MNEQIERIVNHAAQRGDNIDHLRMNITAAYVAGMKRAAEIANTNQSLAELDDDEWDSGFRSGCRSCAEAITSAAAEIERGE